MAERSKALRSGSLWYPPEQFRSLERGVSSNLTVVITFLFVALAWSSEWLAHCQGGLKNTTYY